MTRIRTLKPEFWHDEKMAPLSPIDRLVFLGLISLADDYGRVHDNVKVIDAFIFPETSDSVRESLANLSRIVRIRRGKSSSGMQVLEIVNWEKHQRVDKPQPQKALPAIDPKTIQNIENKQIPESFANHSGIVREKVAPLTTDLRPTTYDHKKKDKKRNAVFEKPSIAAVRQYAEEASIEIDAESFIDYYESKGWLVGRSPMKDWKATVRNWVRRAKESQPKEEPKVSRVFDVKTLETDPYALAEYGYGPDKDALAKLEAKKKANGVAT